MILLERYVQAAAFRAHALVAAILTSMFTLLDFVEQLATVGQGDYRPLNALTFVLLNAPHRLLQVTPVAMLIGTLLALGNLNRSTELTAIRAAGISELRIIGYVAKLVIPIGLVLFLLAEFVIPPAQRLAQEQRSSALSATRDEDSFWAHADNQYLNVAKFQRHGLLSGVEIFSFANDGTLGSYIHGDTANIQPDGTWLLTGVIRKRVHDGLMQSEQLPSLSWTSFVSAHQMRLLRLPLDSMPPVELLGYVNYLKRQQQPVGRLEQAFWEKINVPLSMIAMIMLAAPFVFGPSRGGKSGSRMAMGAAAGIVFTLSQQITAQVGDLIDLTPALTAAAPSLILMGLAIYLFRRSQQ